ncbi:hypothetical protein FPV67DRAFT_1446176 [Lyophyllum atratum]|nr:hypothetical protein FPV67DRAFT_1446176 [Lyophyllum atratum]
MKFFVPVLSALAFLGASNAQRSFIGSPLNGATVTSGCNVVVQVVRPNSIQGSIEVGIVIGLQSCPVSDPTRPCLPPSQAVGAVLFKGTFNPVLHEQPGRPYQNFTVTIPNFLGKAQLSVSRFHLIGAGPAAVLEFNNITLNVVRSGH